MSNIKTVVVPIDFSDTSANALSFAAELSKRTSARLLAVHILQNSDTKEEIKNKLQSVESGLKMSFGSGLKCESSLAHGDIVTALKKIIEAEQADLVIMGTKGASGLKKILIGSNTLKVIAKIKMPVLVIPEVAQFENFLNKGKNRIVLATDLISLENEDALNILKEIALLIIEPKVRVLSVRPKNTSLPHLKRAERNFLLSLFNPEIESESITVFSSNVISGINFYLNKKEDTGLVAMIARDSAQLIQKHYTREMASHTHLPLLVLHDVFNFIS
jgi:nucleotide-binding universal stress UspA family protein